MVHGKFDVLLVFPIKVTHALVLPFKILFVIANATFECKF